MGEPPEHSFSLECSLIVMNAKKMISMSCCSVAVLFSQVSHAMPGGALDGVTFEPIPDGGSLFRIDAGGFELSLKDMDGVLGQESIEVPSKSYWRYACFAVTPWLPSPGKSRLSIYPDLRMDWTGAIDLRDNDDVGLMNLVVESRAFGEEKTQREFFGIDTGMMDLYPLFFPDVHTGIYLGQVETSMDDGNPLVFRSELESESEFRGLFCGLMSSTRLDLSGIEFELIPVVK